MSKDRKLDPTNKAALTYECHCNWRMSISTTASPFEFLDGVKAVGPYFLSTLDVLISFVSLRGPTALDALLET